MPRHVQTCAPFPFHFTAAPPGACLRLCCSFGQAASLSSCISPRRGTMPLGRSMAYSASTLGRPATADAAPLRRTASEQQLMRKKLDLFGSAPAGGAEASQVGATRVVRGAKAFDIDSLPHWCPPSTFRVHTPPDVGRILNRSGAPGGRLSSEDFGIWTASGGFGPGVRQPKPGLRGIRPVSLPSEKAIRSRARPHSAIVAPKETDTQRFVIHGMMRSSDVVGAPESERPRDATSDEPNDDADPKKMNYNAQFLYNDYRCKAEGGAKRKSTSSDILKAVEWQKKQVGRAYALSSWESRLGTSTVLLGDAYAAQRIKEKQRVAELITSKSIHDLTGTQMVKEDFDNVYGQEHALKDTISSLGEGLVPTVDERCRVTRPKVTQPAGCEIGVR